MARKAPALARKARVACEKWREYWKYNIDQYHMMHQFVLGQQWTDDEQEEMVKTFRKVPLQTNHLSSMANSLMGEQQQNTPQLEVVPMEDCDQEVAQLRELIVKDIMFSNKSTTVYQVAAGQSFIGGFSAMCVGAEYSNQKSFDQEIKYYHFKDATRTYFDMSAEDISKTDGERAGYITRMSRTKFRNVYGKDLEEKISKTISASASKEEIALAVQPSDGDDPFTWADNEAITIMDDFVRKYSNETLYKLSNGKSVTQDELDDIIERSAEINAENQQMQMMQQLLPEAMGAEKVVMDEDVIPEKMSQMGMVPYSNNPEVPSQEALTETTEIMTLWDGEEPVRIIDKKQYRKNKIMHYKIAGDYILEETEFPSEQLPMIFVDQNSYYDKNGKQVCRSFFGDAKDTQRYINYLRTQSAYILKVSRYDQFMGSKKNVQGADTRRAWTDPNNTQGLLAYDESPQGHKPEQIRPPELSQSLLSQYQIAIEDLYRTTGLYPTRMGNQGNEVSGKAIDARTRQGSYSTYVAFNSINRAIAKGGEIVNEMIPRVYDSERVITLMTPNEGMKNITVNRQVDEYGEQIENDIRKGTYQVRLKPGPSYEGQKQEALMSLQQIIQADPQAFQLIADLYADNLPLANTIEIKNRLKTLVPPQIIEAGKTGKMPNESGQPSPQEQVMQMQQQMEQQKMMLSAKEVEIKAQELELKKQQIMMDAQFKMQELETERLETAGKLKEQELRYMAETQRTESDAAISHADNLVKILTHKI